MLWMTAEREERNQNERLLEMSLKEKLGIIFWNKSSLEISFVKGSFNSLHSSTP